MTQPLPTEPPEVARRVLTELPVAVVVADLDGKVVDGNPRANALFGPRDSTDTLVALDEWHPRHGTLAATLRSVAGSSSWTLISLLRGEEHIELKGRGLLLDGQAGPKVLLMESSSASYRFAQQSEQVRQLNAQMLIQKKTEDRLRAALQAAKELRRELVHRVKNNLAIISALLRTKARAAEHPAASDALAAAAARIHSISIVHEILDASNETEMLTSTSLFTALLDHLRESICPPHIKLDSEVANVELHTETALPLCLLVNELVTNAIKHAFTGLDAGEVRVTFAEGTDCYHLVVADNGCGMKDEPARKGSGGRIVEALTLQLGGTLVVDRSNGTKCTITLLPSIKRNASTLP